MNVLILSCNTGEGHNSVAKALKERYDHAQIPCTIADTLSFGFKGQSAIISNGHVFVYKHLPRLFGIGYMFEERHAKGNEHSLIYQANINFADKLYHYILDEGFDTVVCVHVFPAVGMTEIQKRYHPSIRTYFVATDYTCSPGTNSSRLDGYFIPHVKLIPEFVGCGIPAEKLHPFGMPIRHSFYSHKSKPLARTELDLPQDRKIVLSMGGSMGAGPIKALIPKLSEALGEDAYLVVICGRNEKLKKKLESYQLPNVRVIGYTTQVSDYMDSADLILTKAGGLSSSEAAAKALPIVYVDAVPGCETRNIEFFCANHYAEVGRSPDEIITLVKTHVCNSAWLDSVSRRLHTEFSTHSADAIVQYTAENSPCNQTE